MKQNAAKLVIKKILMQYWTWKKLSKRNSGPTDLTVPPEIIIEEEKIMQKVMALDVRFAEESSKMKVT